MGPSSSAPGSSGCGSPGPLDATSSVSFLGQHLLNGPKHRVSTHSHTHKQHTYTYLHIHKNIHICRHTHIYIYMQTQIQSHTHTDAHKHSGHAHLPTSTCPHTGHTPPLISTSKVRMQVADPICWPESLCPSALTWALSSCSLEPPELLGFETDPGELLSPGRRGLSWHCPKSPDALPCGRI